MTTIRSHSHSHRRFLPTTTSHPLAVTTDTLELYESDLLYQTTTHTNSSPPNTSPTRFKKASKRLGHAASSLPMNVPDWSKILKAPNTHNQYPRSHIDDDHDGENDDVVPPHEYLARQTERTRVVCFSVHEGVGRTLKGRDLSRVRNAIWEKTGFQD